MKKWLIKKFKPDLIETGVDVIDYKDLYEQGIRLLLLDIDNTLAVHGSRSADAYARSAIDTMKEAGHQVFILSNAKRQRAKDFADSLGLPAKGMAKKPSPKVLRQICVQYNLQPDQCCMIGDQIFTDIWAAKNARTGSILVIPRSDEESAHIKLKRLLEKAVLKLIG